MQISDSILVCSSNAIHLEKLITILEFIGEAVVSTSLLNDVDELINDNNIYRSIILDCQHIEQEAQFIAKYPKQTFLIIGENQQQLVDDNANLIGCLNYPFRYSQLTQELHNCQDFYSKRPNVASITGTSSMLFRSLVGRSHSIQDVRVLIEKVATTEANVLILGESGTGKEVVARNIHNLSDRSKGPFVPINCGAIPGELLESELFGHEKGAFTGAISTRKGRFEMAEGGTLFLDEIGDMPQPMQVKLLRVLQERTFERVGGAKSIKTNVRIIAATHQDLEDMITAGTFREDLFYRLNVFPIETPSLRERKEDIPLLIKELISRFEVEQGQSVRFTEQAIESLKLHAWAGNVRELSNLIERMIIMFAEQVVNVSELPKKYRHIDVEEYQPEYPDELQERDAINELFSGFDYDDEDKTSFDHEIESSSMVDVLPNDGLNLKEYLADLEVSMINQALDKNDWVVARSAELLGMRRTTLVEKMRKYSLQKQSN